MTGQTWTVREVPILEAVASAEERGEPVENLDALAAATGLARSVALLGARTLWEEGFLIATDAGAASGNSDGDDFLNIRLLGPGRRATGQWPPEEAFEAFAGLLSERILDEPDPEKRTLLQRLSDDGMAWAKGSPARCWPRS